MTYRRSKWLSVLLTILAFTLTGQLAMADDWPTYLHDNSRSDASGNETTLSTANAAQLSQLWTFKAGAAMTSQAAVVNGTAYVGSWDGYEYALNASTGVLVWKTYLGQTNSPSCQPNPLGVYSSATVQNGVVYVGGGDSYFYALDAASGSVLWKVFTGDNSATGGHYNWSSPLIYNGYAYVGNASDCDQPLVQGQLLQIDLSTHRIVNSANFVPDGHVGGGVWTGVSLDSSASTIYVTTGTPDPTGAQGYWSSIVAVDASTMAIKDSWQITDWQQVEDPDWSNGPILFKDGNGRDLVAAVNKDGRLYAFDRANLAAGPVWQYTVAAPGPCPECGDGAVSSGAFGAGRLYEAGGNTTVNGVSARGAVRAFDPTTGSVLWEHNAPGVVISPIVYANGLIVDATGTFANPGGAYLEVLSAATGARLYSYSMPNVTEVYNLTLANGIIYASASDGNIYAFGLPTTAPTPTVTPVFDSSCPSGWGCQDIGSAAPVGSETVSGGNFSITAGGPNIAGTSDSFRYLSQSLSGDSQVSAEVLNPGSSGKAGVMIRQSMDSSAPYYAAFLAPGMGLIVQYRNQRGSGTVTPIIGAGSMSSPLYLEIQRTADGFVAATSSDGINYTLVPGSQASVVLPTNALGGLAVTSGSASQSTTAQFGAPSVNTSGQPPATPTAPPDSHCTVGWSCQDIGSYAPAGSEITGTASAAGSAWTIQAAGQDIDSAFDQFRYVWQNVSGDAAVSARVISQTATNSLAKAGVMLRSSADPTAPFYGAFLTPSNTLWVVYRLGYGTFTRTLLTTAVTPPAYLRVGRQGAVIQTYTSNDGVIWVPVDGSSITLNLGFSAFGGVAVTSRDNGVLGTARVDSVAVNSSAVACTLDGLNGAALAARICAAPPWTWTQGQTQTYAVTLTNIGTQTWLAGGTNPVRLAVHFGTTSDVVGDGWVTDQRFSLPADVPPGATRVVTIGITAPTTTGTYVLRAQMEQENVAWTSQILKTNVGVIPPALQVNYSGALPTSWTVGQTASFPLTVTNTGSQVWRSGSYNPVRLSLHFSTQNSPYPGYGWVTDQRFMLSQDVPPGASQVVTVNITAPITPGLYTLGAQLVEENVAWFNQYDNVPVSVADPTAPTATPTGISTPSPTPTGTPTGPALAASYSSNPPTNWAPGQTRTYAVTVTNTGWQTWQAGGSTLVRLGMHFSTKNSPWPGDGWVTDQRFMLSQDVPPGASQVVTVNITAPITPGLYTLGAQLVEENVAWFSQYQGISVSIANPATSTPTSTPTNTPTSTPTSAPTNTPTNTPTSTSTMPALAASYNSTPPATWVARQTQTYAVSVTNTGTQTWNATGTNIVRLGIHFNTSSATTSGTGWATDQRFTLTANVPPGASRVVTVSATAPTIGSYVLQAQMVKENVAWFTQVQNTGVSVAVNPTLPTATATPTGSALSATYSGSPPASWHAGQTQSYSVTVTNNGWQTWNATSTNPVRLSVHWVNTNGSTVADQRFWLPYNIPSGGSVTLSLSVTAPNSTGAYTLVAQMVKENVAWFTQMQTTNVTVGP